MPRIQKSSLSLLLTVALGAAFLVSLDLGPVRLPLLKTLQDLLAGRNNDEVVILKEIRLPRALLGVLVGATLGLAGAAMQGLLRNPLAEPGVLGVTGGASLGAVLMLYTGVFAFFPLSLPLGGIAGALLSVLFLYSLAGYVASVQTLVLAGVALNVVAFSGTSLALNLSRNPYGALEIVFWQMGSLADRSFDHFFLAAPFILAGGILLLWNGRALDALSLGEETAMSLGVPIGRVRFRLILGTALSVGAAVAVTGSVSFIGLVVPHLLRPFVRHEPGKLLGVSALGGAVLLLLADIAVRLIPVAGELKLGILTSLIGAPFFIALIFKMRRGLT